MLLVTLLDASSKIASKINVEQILDKLLNWAIEMGKDILAAVLIYIIGRFVIKQINRLLAKILEKRKLEISVQTFLRKLNAATGKTYRLPTEAEWEYAARGGNKSQGYKYVGSNDLDLVAWYSGNSDGTTHKVGTRFPNELGIYDMSGNVWEWCQDWYGSYSSSPQTNPKGPNSGSYRVYRGGSWLDDARDCRVSFRDYFTPDYRYSDLGFRLAL